LRASLWELEGRADIRVSLSTSRVRVRRPQALDPCMRRIRVSLDSDDG
jgi:hypothetical protein